ncbi:MAG: 2-iminobutanoate/2-iminopropanoate deaminase [Gammaproteobacteria bacterium]|jgi:2-iminobutanoate/2-iminopropanoate deaminase|nr:2-iminobutanoate/2-iminopropanoate deaminase [Gammaproteobacteria bacterium]
MIERRSIHVEGLGHGDLPIPAAARVGPLVATGGVRGVDRMTGKMPTDLAEQVRLMFENLLVILQAAGATRDGILKLTIWIRNNDARAAINREWLAMFPDEHSRPARHIMLYELGGGMLVQCEALAVAE